MGGTAVWDLLGFCAFQAMAQPLSSARGLSLLCFPVPGLWINPKLQNPNKMIILLCTVFAKIKDDIIDSVVTGTVQVLPNYEIVEL